MSFKELKASSLLCRREAKNGHWKFRLITCHSESQPMPVVSQGHEIPSTLSAFVNINKQRSMRHTHEHTSFIAMGKLG